MFDFRFHSGRTPIVVLAFALVCWAMGLARDVQAQASSGSNQTLVIGRVSDNPKRDYPALKAMVDYVVPKLKAVGITQGKAVVAPNNDYMISYLRAGRVDWVSETSGNAVRLVRQGGAQPLLQTTRGGIADYQSVIFKRRDRDVKNPKALLGRTLAVQNPQSTSAYLLPVSELVALTGAPVQYLATPFEKPNAGHIGVVFAQSEANIATWVQKGLVEAGTFSDNDWDNDNFVPMSYRADLEILHRTQSVPRALELVRADLPEAVRKALQQVLLEAKNDVNASAALRAYFNTNGFYPLHEGSRQRLAQLQTQMIRFEAQSR